MIYRSCRIAAIFLAVLLCLSGRLQAQATATVTGVVTDPSESVLVDANVTLTNSSTGTQYTAKTNSAGSYRLTNLPPGPGYTLTISHTGFNSYKVENVYVNVANVTTRNATLNPGENVEISVSAAGQGVTLNTEDATIGNNVQVEKLNELPVQNRLSPCCSVYSPAWYHGDGRDYGSTHRPELRHRRRSGCERSGHRKVRRHYSYRPSRFGSGISRHGGGLHRCNRRWRRRAIPTGNQERYQPVAWSGEHLSSRQLDYGQRLVQQSCQESALPSWCRTSSAEASAVRSSTTRPSSSSITPPRASLSQTAVLRIVPLPSYHAGNVSYINNNPGCTVDEPAEHNAGLHQPVDASAGKGDGSGRRRRKPRAVQSAQADIRRSTMSQQETVSTPEGSVSTLPTPTYHELPTLAGLTTT